MTHPKQGWFKASDSPSACPAADELWSFGRGEMTADRRDAMRDHLTACVWCSEKIARTAELDKTAPFAEPAPADLDRKARRRLGSGYSFKTIWQSQFLWMTLFLASLLISFGTPRYYKQFLVIALVSGIRWALSERARHTLMITKLDSPASHDRSNLPSNSTRHSR